MYRVMDWTWMPLKPPCRVATVVMRFYYSLSRCCACAYYYIVQNEGKNYDIFCHTRKLSSVLFLINEMYKNNKRKRVKYFCFYFWSIQRLFIARSKCMVSWWTFLLYDVVLCYLCLIEINDCGTRTRHKYGRIY